MINEFTLTENDGNFKADFTWTITKIEDKVKQKDFETASEVFEWTGYPLILSRAKLKAEDNGEVYVSLCLKDDHVGGGEEEEAAMDLKPIPQVYYVLKDGTIASNSPKHRCCTSGYLFSEKFNHSLDFCSHLCPKSLLTEPPYNVDNSIVIEIYIETPTMTQSVHSYNGNLHWAIDNYRRRKEKKKEELVWFDESPYFYSGEKGYRVRVYVWVDGFGEFDGRGLTAVVTFLTGEFDADLSSAFPHRTTITLLNRKDPKRNIVKEVVEDVKSSKLYAIDVCSHEEMEQVIENDTVYYQVKIEHLN